MIRWQRPGRPSARRSSTRRLSGRWQRPGRPSTGRSDAAPEGAGPDDAGTAIVEFVLLAVIVMVPLVYLIAAVATVQRNTLAVTQAARDAGRAYATSNSAAEARRRVNAAVRLALADQGLPNDAQLRFVASGASCGAAPVTPRLSPGAEFTVCVTRRVSLPAVPSLLTGRGIRAIGMYTVHVDDYREAAP